MAKRKNETGEEFNERMRPIAAAYRKTHRELIRAYNRKWSKNRNQRERRFSGPQQYAIDIKNIKGCKECGEKHPATLQYHHREPEKKKFNITPSTVRDDMKKVLLEIQKCDVLCANCHFKLHYGQWRKKEIA